MVRIDVMNRIIIFVEKLPRASCLEHGNKIHPTHLFKTTPLT
jgi:hypothetical protein